MIWDCISSSSRGWFLVLPIGYFGRCIKQGLRPGSRSRFTSGPPLPGPLPSNLHGSQPLSLVVNLRRYGGVGGFPRARYGYFWTGRCACTCRTDLDTSLPGLRCIICLLTYRVQPGQVRFSDVLSLNSTCGSLETTISGPPQPLPDNWLLTRFPHPCCTSCTASKRVHISSALPDLS